MKNVLLKTMMVAALLALPATSNAGVIDFFKSLIGKRPSYVIRKTRALNEEEREEVKQTLKENPTVVDGRTRFRIYQGCLMRPAKTASVSALRR